MLGFNATRFIKRKEHHVLKFFVFLTEIGVFLTMLYVQQSILPRQSEHSFISVIYLLHTSKLKILYPVKNTSLLSLRSTTYIGLSDVHLVVY